MEEEIKNLKLEIKVLKQRISDLETKERNRQIFKIIKSIIIILLIIVIAIYGYKLYQDMSQYYNEIKNVLDNPLQGFLIK